MISDADWQLLQAYLDDALSPDQVQYLDTRLDQDVALVAALRHLKSERAHRLQALHSLVPDEADAGKFADRVNGVIRRREAAARWRGRLRIAVGIAACLLIGFSAGWFYRFASVQSQVAFIPQPKTPTSGIVPPHKDVHPAVHVPKPADAGQYQVAILDAEGNVVASQRFSNIEDARQFSEDLQQFEVRRHQIQESQPMLVSDSF